MEKKIKLGSVVRLKGSTPVNPTMVVTCEPAADDTQCIHTCVWFNHGFTQEGSFPAAALEVISE